MTASYGKWVWLTLELWNGAFVQVSEKLGQVCCALHERGEGGHLGHVLPENREIQKLSEKIFGATKHLNVSLSSLL